ncbi:MAG: hypothetical protein JKX69_05940 [Rhodobacteraceae bacterium]|nr:hypothetical protein [Paracoccaceae bacterium]
MSKFTLIGSIGVLSLALSGCGEITSWFEGDDQEPVDEEAVVESYEQFAADGFAMAGGYGDTAYSDPSALPLTGSAEYNGYFGGTVSNDGTPIVEIAGEMVLDVDFSSNDQALDGQVTNIYDSAGNQYTGELTIAGGFIDRDANPNSQDTFGASLQGSLNTEATGDVFITGTIQGDFIGESQEAVAGSGQAAVTTLGGIYELDAGFIAAQ